ncbi:MAG: SDR family NAD(P)-dependent oxidoreductase, partial [Deltaproteobacteria bacterium]|nr:SDR family NAD(P)-dependent oxidoreductase [Deltaproteobacteria bacterium]
MKLSKSTRAVVTGAGGGLGRELCLQLADRGAKICVTDLDIEAARATAQLALKRGAGEARALACDVSKKEQLADLALELRGVLGGLDLLVNNAGVGVGGDFQRQDLDTWEWIMGINLWGVIYGCHHFYPLLKESGGAILNIGSSAGLANGPRMVSYNVTKAAVIALSETLASEFDRSGVMATVVCPTFFKTGMLENTRMLDPNLRKMATKAFEHSFSTAESVARASLRGVERGS